jgi:hypothetical protein
MIPGGKGYFELAVRNHEANHHSRYARLIFGCQDAKAGVNGEKLFLLTEALFFAPYLVNYVFAWRFNPSDVVWQTKNIAVCICVPTPYSLRSTRRSWILSDSEGLDMEDSKSLEPTNLEALQFATQEVEGPSMFE